ncbi:MAG: 3-deoxy-manno-octulosonate cytidylyltransferase [Bacteroidales bacterium]|nr:3-deoxy-manno-octulosonate cytidylyltransferase [Bacteroidales bacterium]
MNFLGIIPARYASARLPGKPLANLAGKPLIQWVYESAMNILENVVVATDDKRILEAVMDFGGEAVMTSDQHRSGTDRCAEASEIMKLEGYPSDIVINIQGDEPFTRKEQIDLLMDAFSDPTVEIATLAGPVQSKEDLFDPNVVKVVRRKDGNALFFSRSTLPFIQHVEKDEWFGQFNFLHHLGIYAYRYNTLHEITQIPQSSLELAESLEQNRWLENGKNIRVCLTDQINLGIDTPEDLEKAEKIIADRK